jgi:hypothetical protein
VPADLQSQPLDCALLLRNLSQARSPEDSVTEPWLDRKKLAEHYSCSVRKLEEAIAEGMPCAVIFGRKKFRVSDVEPWLEERGYLQRG